MGRDGQGWLGMCRDRQGWAHMSLLIILLPEYGLYSTLQDFNYIEEV
jgi:hypothetical protein